MHESFSEKKACIAEERASAVESQKRRLELDLAEASSSLERLSKERKREASLPLEVAPEASLTLEVAPEASMTLEDKEKTHKQKRNARRRKMKKRKQDRNCHECDVM